MNELSSARAVFLVARREFVTRVRSRVFVVATVLSVAAVAAYVLFQLFVFDRINSTPSFTVGFTADARALAGPLQAVAPAYGETVHVSGVADRGEGEGQVRAGTLDAFVTGAPASPRVVVQTRLDPALRSALDGVVRQEALNAELRSAGLDPAAVQARASAASVQVQVLQAPSRTDLQQPLVGLVIAFVLFAFLQIYGGLIAQGVVAEKTSRVVEILLATIRPAQLLVGKVVGIGLVGLLQLVIIGAAGLALTLPTHILTIPAAAGGAVASGLVWFVLGFLLYAFLLAMSAAPVSRTEEVQGASLPVTLLLAISWLMAFVTLGQVVTGQSGSTPSPGAATASTVLSLLPPFAPVLMPIRIAAGDAPAWQVLLAVALELAGIAATAWLAARVYAGSILRFGTRMRLSDALRSG